MYTITRGGCTVRDTLHVTCGTVYFLWTREGPESVPDIGSGPSNLDYRFTLRFIRLKRNVLKEKIIEVK